MRESVSHDALTFSFAWPAGDASRPPGAVRFRPERQNLTEIGWKHCHHHPVLVFPNKTGAMSHYDWSRARLPPTLFTAMLEYA